MTGWNPHDPNIPKEVIDVVNSFWWVNFKQSTQRNEAFRRLGEAIIDLRRQNSLKDRQIEFLMKLIDEMSIFPKELSTEAALGNEKETWMAFQRYVKRIGDLASKKLDVFKIGTENLQTLKQPKT